ncbi:methyltransferase family protein [Motilibacter rhizosphaerae]|uniref:Methyltransferase family protein n=1 Tax=Motilibacter rhizosphaerae TaxID=598652 RepID=A0A4Q7NWS8_9ACTN|nr:class I SAM-dependent methyltransferase [Motilibacter rhizosphaerae]RZS91783.1 methyltransferase family protein [Motilibacter rhizosphaerae]
MAFDSPDAYDRFMGRWSSPLADAAVAALDPSPGTRVLDVGCGPGALTTRLVARVGAAAVTAVDPSPRFVAALAERLPGVATATAAAESLPFADASYDLVVAQLVVHFMADPLAGLREMARVVRPGGRVAVSVWDHLRSPIDPFWTAAQPSDLADVDLARPGVRAGSLAELVRAAGLEPQVDADLVVECRFATFEEWWEPFTMGVGPAGDHVTALSPQERDALRDACESLLPPAPFTLQAAAWWVVAERPGAG